MLPGRTLLCNLLRCLRKPKIPDAIHVQPITWYEYCKPSATISQRSAMTRFCVREYNKFRYAHPRTPHAETRSRKQSQNKPIDSSCPQLSNPISAPAALTPDPIQHAQSPSVNTPRLHLPQLLESSRHPFPLPLSLIDYRRCRQFRARDEGWPGRGCEQGALFRDEGEVRQYFRDERFEVVMVL